ncbi:centromere-associated protein E isoform X1 [Tachysurus vachellii]|uniref:centromere-associated protein E isoform X1 n=1 Tax=Tachysurus vachellii TaxID=175792 RepID=UPI00296ABCC8|nr:centromere-associated protein E isoform X1 [Tachysurus vachellii]XP_060740029.1 centromere-associated protein E isoform X1 [Tachysurus vachellii]
MEFPVDILATMDPGSLEQTAKSYMSKLLYRNSEIHEYLNIPGSKKIEIGLCNVSFVPLYGVDIKQKILALFSPEETLKAVGLYLLDQWWSAEDILKTADSSRTGLIKVRTPGERIVLYVLNRIIYRTKEMVGDDVPFPCHGEDEIAKILWKNGEAIGFYSVKPEGSLCKTFLTHRYQIPVMDTIFIRKDYRGHGHGLQMLEDFIVSFRQEIMGLSYPLSPAMFKVCKKYMSLYPDDTELLWEIVGVGSPFQRIQIARKLQAMDLNENHQVEGELNFEDTEDSDIPKEAGITQVQETMEFMEVVEEVVKIKITKELQDTTVITLGRSSNLKRKKLEADTEETNEKIIRVEDTESDIQCAENDPVQEDGKISFHLKESELKDTMETVTHDSGYPKSDNTHLHCEEQNKMIPDTTQMSETENKQVPEMTPVMEIQSLKCSDLQPIECQQVVEVEIVNMSLETDELKEKAGEVNESKNDIDKEILLHGRETSEGIVEVKKDQTDMAETINNEDIEDEVEMGKISVGKHIVDDREEIENDIAGTLEVTFLGKEQTQQVKEKDKVEETGLEGLHEREQVPEDQEPSPNNKEEKVSMMIQQEENVNMAFSLGSKWKHADKRRSNYETPSKPPRRLKDQTAGSELTKSTLRSSSKKTIIATSKQVCTRQSKFIKQPELLKHIEEEPKLKRLKQIESQPEKEQIENLTAAHMENEEGLNIKKDCLNQPKTDDQTPMEVDNNSTLDVNNAKASEPSAVKHLEDQEEEPASTEGDSDTDAILKWQIAAETLVESTEKQKVIEMTDNEIIVVEEKNKDSNIEEREIRYDKIGGNFMRKVEDKVPDENKIDEAQEEEPKKIQNEEPEINNIESSLDYAVETIKDVEKMPVFDVNYTEAVRVAEIEVEGKSPEPFESVKEQEEEQASETGPAEEVNRTEEARTQKQQNVAAMLLNFNKFPVRHENNVSEMNKGISQPQEEVVQDKSESSYNRNKDNGGLSQTKCEVEPFTKEQNLEMTEDDTMEIELTFNNDKKIDEAQKEDHVKRINTTQDIPFAEPEIQDDRESSENEEGLKTYGRNKLSEEEKIKTVTLLRQSRRLEHQAAESELTKRVLRSSAKATSKTKAVKQQVKTKQPLDDPELEQMEDVMETHTETTVEEEIESVNINTETEHKKAVELEVEGKAQWQCAAETVKEQEEEPASETGLTEDNSEEATSDFKLQEVAVVIMDCDKDYAKSTDPGKGVQRTSHPQKKVDLELHMHSTDTESQAEHTEKKCETDETVESEEGVVLNDDDRVPKAVVTDEENMEEVQKETDPAQEIPGEKPKSLHLIGSSEENEDETSVVPVKLEEWEENEATSVTPLRRSPLRQLKDQAAGSELTKNVLRRSAQLTNQATPQQRQIKAMIHLEDPKQRVESKNNEMNIILGSEVAVGGHMESETVHVFAENDPKNRISVVQNTCEEGISLDKVYIEAEDHENPRKSNGNDVENVRKENFTEQDKMAPEDIIHGETEQICTSECVKEDEDTIQEDSAATEMAHREDLMETTSTLTLQEASVVLVDVTNVHPNLTGEFCSTSAASQEKRSNKLELRKQAVDIPEEVKEELQTEAVGLENIEKVNPTEDNLSHMNPAAKDTDVDESRVVNSIIEDEASKLKEKYSDECKMGEDSKTEKFILQNPSLTKESDHNECLETATHVQCILHHNNTEQNDELATDLAPEEVREKGVESTSIFTLHQSDLHMDFQRQSSENETDGNETTQPQKGEMLIKDNAANEDKVLVEMNVTEPVTERKDEEGAKEAAAIELGMDNTLITNNGQDGDILAEEDVKGDLKETEDTTLKCKYASAELASKKTLVECHQITTSVQGVSVQENRNLRPSTVIVKSLHFQNVCKETKVNKNTEAEISDEEDETVFIRHLRGRTVTVTPRRSSKRITDTNVVELDMEGHVTKFCHEIVAVQSTEESRTAVIEIHETNSKYDNKEIPAVSGAERKDQQQDKDKPGIDVDKVENVTDGRKDVVEETVVHKEVETKEGKILVEVDLPEENQEKEVRNANSKQESDQQDNALEEMLLEKTFEKEHSKKIKEKCFEEAKDSTINTLITKGVHDQDAEGVEIKALRKRTITIKPAPVRKSKQFCRQDQGENEGQTLVWANNQHSATVDATEMEVADVKSQEENKTTDQGKAEEIKGTNTVGQEISHKDEDQGNTREEETYRNANNRQEITVTENKSKFLNMSEEVTHTKIVAQEMDKVEEKREKHSATEDIMESVNNAGKADKVAGKPQDVKDSQEEQEQSEENAKEITESWVTLHETFTLELDKEIDSNNTECNQVVEETKASGQESEKEITDTEEEYGVMTKRFLRARKSAAASPAQGSACTRRELMLDFQSEIEDKSGAEEVKEVVSGKKEKKPQQKRTAVDELTPRRSKRLARAEIM